MLRSFTVFNRAVCNRLFVRFNSSSTNVFEQVVKNIRNDLKLNFRQKGDVMEKNVIRSILTEIKNLEIKNHNKAESDKFQLYELFTKMIKQREETAKEYLANTESERHQELGQNELKEVGYISKYLDQLEMASNEEIRGKLEKIIEEVVLEGGEVNLKNIYKKVPMKVVEKEWNCSKAQIKQEVNQLLGLN